MKDLRRQQTHWIFSLLASGGMALMSTNFPPFPRGPKTPKLGKLYLIHEDGQPSGYPIRRKLYGSYGGPAR